MSHTLKYTFLVQLLQEYPITDSQFQKLLFQSSDSSSLWIRVLRAADQSLTNISFCVGWSRLITHARIILLKKRKSKEIRTEGWNYISACLKKCAIKKDAMIKKDAVGILNLVIVQIFEPNFLNIWLKKLSNFRVSSADLVFEFYRDLLLLGCVREIPRARKCP